MAISKTKKEEVVQEIGQLLSVTKLTVVASYQGTDVKGMQQLRKAARENHTTVRVAKNRLVAKALLSNDQLKGVDLSALKGQLLYAFNAEDEVAGAQVLATFAKTNPSVEFIGAITPEGVFMAADDVKALAALPSKDQLRAQLIGTLQAPFGGFVNVLAGNVRGILNVLNARAESL